jgi:putative ABC transport system ATP-binding protein
MANSLSISSLTKSFGTRTVWSNLTFDVDPGTITAIVGASGSGKTSLLNCIGGLEAPDSGSVTLNGSYLNPSTPSERRQQYRDNVGFLFQNYGLVESWTIQQNLDVVLRFRGKTKAQRDTARTAALGKVGLALPQKTKIFTLSGGEQQRLALAKLLLNVPGLVLADEPTSALDDENAALVMAHLRAMAETGSMVLISTHDPRVFEKCDLQLQL